MSEATQTNNIVVIGANRAGATVAVNGENKCIGWADLREASRQYDGGLQRVYQQILQQAEAVVAGGPVVVEVRSSSTGVMWECVVYSAISGGQANYTRRSDEGMEHPQQWLAAVEAADICDRLGARVERRIGFDSAKARAQTARFEAEWSSRK